MKYSWYVFICSYNPEVHSSAPAQHRAYSTVPTVHKHARGTLAHAAVSHNTIYRPHVKFC